MIDTHAELATPGLDCVSQRTLSMTCTTPLDVSTSDRMMRAVLELLVDTYVPEELLVKVSCSPEAEV
jgi:hypothetical protein